MMDLKVRTIRELLERTAVDNPEGVVYLENGAGKDRSEQICRKELCARAALIAGELHGQGLAGCAVALLSESSLDWIQAFYALCYGGNPAVLLNQTLTEELLRTQVAMADCKALLYSESYRELAVKICDSISGVRAVPMDGIRNREIHLSEISIPGPAEQDTAAVIFTSGSTGVPKAVELTNRNLLSSARSSSAMLGSHAAQTVLILPLYHAFGLITMLDMAYLDGCACVAGSIRRAARDVAAFRPAFLCLSPGLAELLVRSAGSLPGETLREKLGGKLEGIFCGGSAMPESLYDTFSGTGIELFNGYGLSECSAIVTTNCFARNIPGSMGWPISCNEVKLSEEGEILVRGDNVMKGYYHDEKSTEDAFVDGWFRSGDLGRIGESGELWFTGRIKNLIILSNGENVPAEALEQPIAALPCVLGVKARAENDLISLEVFPDWAIENVEEMVRTAVEEMNRGLPSSWRVCDIMFRKEDFERSSMGKIIG